MELHKIGIRALLTFIFLLVIIRISGKRTVSEGNTFDFVLALILGDVIDDALWAEVPMSQFFVAAGVLVLMDTLANVVTFRSAFMYRVINGSPSKIMANGSTRKKLLRREQMSRKELLTDLRLEGIEEEDIDQVYAAFVEPDGLTSIIRSPGSEPAKKRDLRGQTLR
jgi:uncharacterized membrane protein YcaP (DUF421 family)